MTSGEETTNDTTVTITASQLKTTCLIFADHQRLTNLTKEQEKLISVYKQNIDILNEVDSIRTLQISSLQISYNLQINDITAQLSKQKKQTFVWKVGGISVSCVLLIWLCLK